MSEQLDRLKEALSERYRVERELGSGGMATVYLAEDLRHDRQVAVKVLRPDLAATLGPERFHREIKIAAQLQHPNILPLLDSGESEGFLYYVMPYIEGQSLRDKLAKEGELPIGEAVRLMRDVVDALTEAHAHGVVHRDIKPENILLRGRHAMVTDFGVAKAVSEATGREQLTTAGVALGTPAYMAPEQASADPHVDHRVDIYAVGAVAYELLTGRPVFMGTTPQMVLSAHVTEVPQTVTKHRETVPIALEQVIMRCLEKKPADRWQSAEELLPQLEALATPSGGMTPAATQPISGVRPRMGHGSIAKLVASVAAVVALALVIWQPWRSGSGTPSTGALPKIAVLYLANLSSDSLDASLAEGLTLEITSRLARVAGIRTKSQSAVRQYRDSMPADPSAAASLLGVDYVVEGSVRRSTQQLRVSVSLVKGDGGFQVWSDDFDPDDTDLLSMQEEIARQVATHVGGELGVADAAEGEPTHAVDQEAYAAFVRGQGYMASRNLRSVQRAIEQYAAATRLDSSFAPAWAYLAYGYGLFLDWGWDFEGLSRDEVLQRGLLAADRALAADSMLSDGWMARGYLSSTLNPKTFDGVRGAFDRAIVLDSLNVEALHQYAWLLMMAGDDSTAIELFKRVIDLEPERAITAAGLGYAHDLLRQYDRASVWYDSAVALDPGNAAVYWWSGMNRLLVGDTAAARGDAATAQRLGRVGLGTTMAGVIEAMVGNTQGAVEAIQRLIALEHWRGVAEIHLALGEDETALQYLERGAEAAWANGKGLEFWSEELRMAHWDPVRADPRFQRLVRESGGVPRAVW